MFSGGLACLTLISIAHGHQVTPTSCAGLAPASPALRPREDDLVLFQAGVRKSIRHATDSQAQHQPQVVDPYPQVTSPEQSSVGIWARFRASVFWHTLHGLTLVAVIKAICVMSNMVVQVSPFPQVRNWEALGDTGETDAAPYVSIAYGGMQWCFYGLFAYMVTWQSGFLILIEANSLGAMLGAYYTATFFRVCKSESSKASACNYLSAAASLAVFQVCTIGLIPLQRALLLVGLVSAFCSFAGALSVLVTTPQVIKTRNARSIAGPLVTANMVSSFAWIICGCILGDRLIIIPSSASCVACTFCVYLKLVYPSTEEAVPLVCGTGETEEFPLMPRLLRHHRAAQYGTTGATEDMEPSKDRTISCRQLSTAREMKLHAALQIVDEDGLEKGGPAPATGGTF